MTCRFIFKVWNIQCSVTSWSYTLYFCINEVLNADFLMWERKQAMYLCSSWNNNFFLVGAAVLNDLYSHTIILQILVLLEVFLLC